MHSVVLPYELIAHIIIIMVTPLSLSEIWMMLFYEEGLKGMIIKKSLFLNCMAHTHKLIIRSSAINVIVQYYFHTMPLTIL